MNSSEFRAVDKLYGYVWGFNVLCSFNSSLFDSVKISIKQNVFT